MNQTQKRFIQTRHELHQHPELSNQETATAGRNLNLFESFKPDFAFALHNMPGVPLGQVQCKTGPFACASRGMIIRLKGKPSHAAYPEDGISPAKAMCRVIEELSKLPDTLQGFNLVTVVYAAMGEVAFGIAPEDAVTIQQAFRCSEDFGRFTEICEGAIFTLGTGNKGPQLHNPDYDFPDQLIPVGLSVFREIISEINGLETSQLLTTLISRVCVSSTLRTNTKK